MTRWTVAVALAAVLLAGCGKDTTPSSAPPASTSPPATTSSSCPAAPPLPAGATLVTASVAGTKVESPHRTWDVRLGSNVRIAVTADRADEVHVHGYDKKADTVPGCPTAIDLVANVPGSVEVELEHAALHLLDLKAS